MYSYGLLLFVKIQQDRYPNNKLYVSIEKLTTYDKKCFIILIDTNCLYAWYVLKFFWNILIMYYDEFQLNFCNQLNLDYTDVANEGHFKPHRRNVMHSSELVCHTWMFIKCTDTKFLST